MFDWVIAALICFALCIVSGCWGLMLGERRKATSATPLPRINNGTDAVARGQRWEAFYTEDGGLADMIASLRRDYFEKVGALAPGDTDGLRALGMADRIAREIERKVQSVIETGKLEASKREHINRVAAIRR